MKESIKNRLQRGERVTGVLSPSPDAAQAELLARLGWDFVLFDAEHGALEPKQLHDLVRAVLLGGAHPMVRTPGQDRHIVTRYLESGATGLMAPMVESAAQAAALVAACHYPPAGVRGIAGSPATGFGLSGLADKLVELNSAMLVVAQIETAAGLEDADAIAATPGVDVVFLGTMDLSASLGRPADFTHPDIVAASRRVAEAAIAAGKPLGMLLTHPKQMALADALGALFVTVYADSIIGAGTQAFRSAG